MTASYQQAGVNIDQANLFVERIKPLVKKTTMKEVMSGIGGLFHLDLKRNPDPVLVSSTDGVGTKLKIAQILNRHDTIGIDWWQCVSMTLSFKVRNHFFFSTT